MANTKFDKLIGLLEPLENDSVGEWIIDKEHKGTEDDPKHFPYPMYTEVVNELIEVVYEFEHENPEYELTKYGELLRKEVSNGDNGQWRMRMFPIWMRKVLWHYLWAWCVVRDFVMAL